MRRESATVVSLTGQITGSLLAALGRSGNVSIARPPAAPDKQEEAGGRPLSGWEPGAQAMREAARRRSMFVIVPDDPMAGVATAWSTMWEPAAGPGAPQAFEAQAAHTLAAWRDKQFELPDYYIVTAPAERNATGPDFYLGPMHAVRPRRVAVAGVAAADAAAQAALLLDMLRSLEHGPWWPPLDELLDAVRHFFADSLAESAAAE